MDDQVEQLAGAVITDEAETAERLKKMTGREQPKMQTLREPRTSRCCRQSDSSGRAARSEWRALLEKQLSLPATELAARQDQGRSAGGAGRGQR